MSTRDAKEDPVLGHSNNLFKVIKFIWPLRGSVRTTKNIKTVIKVQERGKKQYQVIKVLGKVKTRFNKY